MTLDEFVNNFKDSYSSLKERFTSPFYLSFIISWIFYNWRIIVALFWYDPEQFYAEGYGSIFGYIYHNINFGNTIGYPFLWGLIFSILNPVLRFGPALISSIVSKWAENLYLSKVRPGSGIAFEKYLELSKELQKKGNDLKFEIDRIKNMENESKGLKDELNTSRNHNEVLENTIDELESFVNNIYNLSMLDGIWEVKYKNSTLSEIIGKQNIEIKNGKWLLEKEFGEFNHTATITNFTFDVRNKSMFFIKNNIISETENRPFLLNSLQQVRKNLLIGDEISSLDKQVIKIEYRRIK